MSEEIWLVVMISVGLVVVVWALVPWRRRRDDLLPDDSRKLDLTGRRW